MLFTPEIFSEVKMLTRLFSRKKSEAKEHRIGSDYIEPLKAEQLLNTDRRKVLLDLIWEQTSMSKESFLKLYLAPVPRLAGNWPAKYCFMKNT